MPDWLLANIQWIFSGVGVFILTGVIGWVISWVRKRRQPVQAAAIPSLSPLPARPSAADVEILPLSFEAALGQEIPYLRVSLYVVNHLRNELVIQSLKIPQFSFTGGPAIADIHLSGEARVPARRSSLIVLQENLIDSEVAAIRRTQTKNPTTAGYGAMLRGLAGRAHPELELLHIASNGWVSGLSQAT